MLVYCRLHAQNLFARFLLQVERALLTFCPLRTKRKDPAPTLKLSVAFFVCVRNFPRNHILGMDPLLLFAILLLVIPSVISEKSECRSSSQFGDGAKKEGYAECLTGQQYLYLKGLEVRGANDNLKDISAGKCCRPPRLHQDWPFTCHSADWQLSFSR